MAKSKITMAREYSNRAEDLVSTPIPVLGQGAVSNVAYTTTAAQSGALDGSVVRLVATTAVYVLFGTDPEATVENGSLLPANTVEYFKITEGHKVSVIRVADSGSLNITVCV